MLFTAPLIPIGAWQASDGVGRDGTLIGVLRVVCVLVAVVFGLLGVALLVAATGVTESGDDASSLWLGLGIYFLAVAGLLGGLRARLSR